MSKRLLRYYFFSIIFILSSCVPRVAPPPIYKDKELSLEEIIELAPRDIHTLKAIVSISAEKNKRRYSSVNASLLLKKPNWVHIRFYSLGIPAGSYLIKDNVVKIASGKRGIKLGEFGRELYHSIIWWDGIEDAIMYRHASRYIIRTKNREIWLNGSTLLPESQEIIVNNKKIFILYDKPKRIIIESPYTATELWYPSVLKIEIGQYTFNVRITKLFINPPLKKGDFEVP
jgi:hypothetical protein